MWCGVVWDYVDVGEDGIGGWEREYGVRVRRERKV